MVLLGIRGFFILLTLLCHRAFSANAPLGSSGSPNSIDPQTPPPPTAGETPDQWIQALFAPTAYELDSPNNASSSVEEPQLTKRNSSFCNGIISSSWTNETENRSYDIRLDTSNSNTGVNYSTDIGVYTFTDGHTTNSTTFKDMIDDIYTLHQSTVNPRTRQLQIVNTKYANHTLALAKLAMKEANEALLVMLCRNETKAIVTAPGYDFSQAPLVPISPQSLSKRDGPRGYWLAVFAASVGGGLFCGGALVPILSSLLNETITAYNIISVGMVVGVSAFLAGALYRCQAVGRLDNAANRIDRRIGQPVAGAANAVAGAAANALPNPVQVLDAVAPGGREAVVQNVLIAWFREKLRRVVRGAVQEAVDEAISEITSGSFGTPQGTLEEFTDALGDIESCLTMEEAARQAGELQNMFSQELEMQPLNQLEDAVNEHQAAERGGQCVIQ